MTRSSLAALLMMFLSAPAAWGQAKLLPPSAAPFPEAKTTPVSNQIIAPPRPATIGPPTSLPPAVATVPEVPQTGPPHQMYGREPAHGTKTAGVLKGPPILPTVRLPEQPVIEVVAPVGRWWAELDYLAWWVPGDKLPPLVTTSPTGSPQGQAGVIDALGTAVLGGGKEINRSGRSGVRFNTGYWLDQLQTIGIQAGGFLMANGKSSNTFVSTGDPILARPFFDATVPGQSAELVAYPGFSSGSVSWSTNSSLNGWDIAIRQNAGCSPNGRVDAILGYRQLRLADRLGIAQDVTSLTSPGPRALPAGAQYVAIDRFDTENEFCGAEFGIVGEWRCCRWVFEGTAKLAAGWNTSHVAINGATLTTLPATPTVVNSGGFLALPSNIGLFRRSDGALIPEFGANIAYEVNDHLRFRGGYTFLYWDQVYRTGQQIDLAINPNLLPQGPGGGPARPTALREETDLFVHGLNFGVEVRY